MVTVARLVSALAIGLVMLLVLRGIEPPSPGAAPLPASVPTADAARSAERALEALAHDLTRLTAAPGRVPVTVVAGGELVFHAATADGAPEEIRYRLIPGPAAGIHLLERTARADDPEAPARPVDAVHLRSMRARVLTPRPDPAASWQARSSDASTYLEILLEATDATGSASVRRLQVHPLTAHPSTARETTKG